MPRGRKADDCRVLICRDERILWVNRENMIACIEAGAIGQDIADKLEKVGLTMGHHPDSREFSSIGGWVSTRAMA